MFPAYSVGDASRPAPPPPPPSALRGGASASSPRLRRLLSVACVAVALLAVLCSSAAHPAAVLLRRACADAINAALVAVLGIVSLAWSLLGLVVIAPCRAAFAIATGAAEPSYAGQVVLVTGASSGIGEAIALRICRLAGAQSDRQDAQKAAAGLVLVARRGDRLAELQRRCGDLSGGRVRALAVVADVAIEADGARMVHAAVSEFGRLDLVILNAGIPGPHARLDQLGAASERFHELMNVNFFGQVVCYSCMAFGLLSHVSRAWNLMDGHSCSVECFVF